MSKRITELEKTKVNSSVPFAEESDFKKSRILILILSLIMLFIAGKNVSAQTILNWNPASLSGYGPSPWAPTTPNANLTVGGLTRASGVGTGGSAASAAWGGAMVAANLATPAAALAGNQFVTFSITANSTFKVSLSTFDLFYRRSGGGPASGVLQYAIGAGSYTDIATLSFTNSSSSGAALSQVSLSSISALQNVAAGSAINFRILLYANGPSTGGTWYVYSSGLSIGGTVASAGTSAVLSNITTQPSGSITQGSGNVVLSGFKITPTASVNFTAVTVTGSGTATATDITSVRVFKDNDGNGAINGADASVSGSGVSYAASMPITISGETGFSAVRNYLIVANVAGVGVSTAGRTVTASVGSGAFTTTATSNTGSATGNSRTISAPVGPTKLVVTTISPSSPIINSTFDVTVQSQDASSNPQNVLTNTGVTISRNIGTGNLGGTLTGTINAGTSSVIFTGLTYDVAESGVSLTATRTSGDVLTSGNSSSFTVLGVATQLSFSGVPSTGSTGANLTSFTVRALRADNSLDVNYTGSITVSKNSGPGTLTGTLTVNAVAGVATFSTVQTDAGGTITLAANASGLTPTVSGNIVITATPSLTELIYPLYAINGNTTASRLQYVCRLRVNNLTPGATYRYITSSNGAGNMFVINNTVTGAAGYITGHTSSKNVSGSLMSNNEFSTSARYGEFTTDVNGSYTGWFSMVPTSNAVFAAGNTVTFTVQINDGAGGTTVTSSINTSSPITMLNPASGANGAQAIKGTSAASAENMIFLYDNTNGTGRPLFGTWAENDGIPTNFSTWYNAIESTNGSWGAYIPVSLPNGLQRIEQRSVSTGDVIGCVAIDSNGVWPTGSVNTVNPAGGTTPLVISNTDAPLTCPILNTITTGTVSGSSFCIDEFTGANVSVPFTSTDVFNAGNIYRAQLSNASGSFASPLNIGSLTSTANSGTISAQIPGGTTVGTGYRIRVISTDPSIIGTDNGSDLAVTSGTGHYIDIDGDGYGDDASLVVTCVTPGGYIDIGGDCDDFTFEVNPGASEVCDGLDNDCNSQIDEGVKLTFYADADNDTYGNPSVTTLACTAPVGYVANNTDCDDANVSVNPGATEQCNAIDDDCDASIDEGCSTFTYFIDADNDNYGNPAIFISSASPTPPAGYVGNNTDCDDNNAAINPAAAEICNGIDDNCIGGIDNGLTFTNYYADLDADTYGGALLGSFCSQPSGSVTVSGDCDDNNAAVHPNAIELCGNAIDDDCDNLFDETTLLATESHTAVACNGGTSTVTISATGGVAPFTGTGNFTQSAGTQTYVVTDAAGCSSNVNVTVTEPALITVTSFSPSSATAGTTITITGSGFTGATDVKFNGTSATSFSVNSNTQITAVIPVGATSGVITVLRNSCSASSAASLRILSISSVIVPQYIQGLSGTNNTRVPYAYRVALGGLLGNATYRYYNQMVISTDGATTAGAGNVIFANPAGFVRTTSPSFSTTNNYGTFTTDASGNYTGWFINEATGNARFAVGNNIYLRIILNDGGTGTSAAAYLTTPDSVKVINFVNAAGANNGTALRGISSATAKNLVFVYDNVSGTGRPLAGTFVESDGTANTTANSYAAFYANNVEGVSGSYGLIIPNTNTNGVQRIEQRDFATGAIAGCVATDADGVWPSGANTVNPTGGTSEVVITATDAPLYCPILNTITTGTITPSSFCADAINGAAVSVPFTSTDVFNPTNIYTAQLSDATGSFASPVTIGTLASTANSGTISATIPAGTLTGTAYRIRVISSDPSVIGTNNGADLTITTGATYYADADADTYGNSSVTVIACTAPTGYVANSTDCDDLNPAINPGATEVCDNVDNDCDAQIDEGVKLTFYADADNDTYGNPSVTSLACTAPVGYVVNNTDCDDNNASINPGITEICGNGIDDNCDTNIDEGCASFTYFADADNDTYGNPAIFISSASPTPPSGYVTNNTDCDDSNASINPAAAEICNGIDDNCIGGIDNGLTFTNYYADLDADTYGGALLGSFCSQPSGSVTVSGDCDDNNAAVHPNAIELCGNGIDDDCDAAIDETTLLAAESHTVIACNGGTSTVTISATGGVAPYTGTGDFTQSAGTQSYTVTDAAGCTSSVNAVITQPAAITVTLFTPAFGTVGSTITITGTGFTGATGVTFNGISAVTFTVTNSTTITAIVPAGASSGLITVVKNTCTANSASSLRVITLTETIVPQFIQGNTTTNSTRVPYAYRVSLGGLLANATYRYYNQVVTSADGLTTAGAGNIIFANPAGFVRTSSPSLSSANNYGTFTTDASGNYSGWFITEPSGNARFAAGNSVFMKIILNDGGTGTSAVSYLTTTSITKVINFATTAGANNGTGLRGASSATAKNFVMVYDNVSGAGRPLSGTFVESDGTANTTANSYVTFYDNNVNSVVGSYGIIIPNNNANGVQRIEQRDFATGAIAGCVATDADGVWPSGANTVNPLGGTTPVVITNTDASFVCPILNTITTGTITPSSFCADAINGAAVSVPFTSTDVFNPTNIYTAQLSDATGSFASPVTIGTLASTANSGTISATIPAGTLTGTAYRIRVISSDPSVIGTNNGADLTITTGTTYYADADADTYGNLSVTTIACAIPSGYVANSTDCDDNNAAINPGATEVCDNVDNDCDTQIDEGVKLTFYADADNDTYGNPAITTLACTAPSGYVANSTDCDDNNASINPGITEICGNGIDDNCDTNIDEGCASFTYFADADNDTYGNPAVFISSTNPIPPAGYVTNNTDCDDNNAAVHPGVTETCNGLDDDCVGGIDNGLTFTNYYADLDADTYGGALLGSFCSQPSGSVTVSGDCDDNNAAVHPNAIELCGNGIDDDCDAAIDETTLLAAESHTAIACNGGTSTVTISATGGVAPYTGIGNFTQSAGTQTYVVTDAAGCTSSVNAVITQPAAITVTSFTPAFGTVGSTITITGTGFTGATGVKFNGVSAVTFNVVNATQITAIVPPGASSGIITILRNTCTANSTNSLRVITLTDVIVPQYMQGLSGTNSSRTPYAYRVALGGLLANATYRYYNQVVTTADGLTTAGAGNIIFANPAGFVRTTGPSLSSANNYGTFTTDASGNYTGWFITEPSGNARFAAGNNVFMKIILNDGGTGTSAVSYLTTNNSTTVINYATTAGANNGTGLRGVSAAVARNFVLAYDNVNGTGRPLSGTFVESDGTANTTANSYVPFYATNVEAAAGSYGMIIPNNNINGVRRIEQRELATGTILGCPGIDADGVWPSGANTVNPLGGTTPVVITNTDANLGVAPTLSTVVTNVVCFGESNGAVTLTVSGGSTPYSFLWSNGAITQNITNVAAGTYTVTVTALGGCSSQTTATVTQPDAIVVNSFAPASGNIGDPVTITGSGFTAATAVLFNGTGAVFTVDNDGQISTSVPAGATDGLITVQRATCSGSSGTNFIVTSNAGTLVNLQLIIQGFYIGGGQMSPALFNTGVSSDPNDVDSIIVELHDVNDLYTPYESVTGILKVDGTLSVSFSAAALNRDCYIVIKHRNSMETWSKDPVHLSNTNSYDFIH